MERDDPKKEAQIAVDTPTGRTWVVYGDEQLNNDGPLIHDLLREYELTEAGIVFNDNKQQFEYDIEE